MGIFSNWFGRKKTAAAPESAIHGPSKTWDPKYPDAARLPNAGTKLEGRVGSEEQPTTDFRDLQDWVSAPDTSHIDRMKIVSAGGRKSFLGRETSYIGGQADDFETKIHVTFKPNPKTGKGGGEYVYLFRDYNTALYIWSDLISSPHPYGEVLYPRVIKAGVPYRPIWKG